MRDKIDIRSYSEYEEALERIWRLVDAEPGTPEAKELKVLTAAIEKI